MRVILLSLYILSYNRRESWKITQDDAKSKLDKKRKRINSKRSEVSVILIILVLRENQFTDKSLFYIFHLIIRKKKDANEVLYTCTILMMKFCYPQNLKACQNKFI